MATLKLYRNKLKHNYKRLNKYFTQHDVNWAVTTKLLCGNQLFLEKVLELPVQQICDSRVSNLKIIKKIDPNIDTIYIKPPPKNIVESIVKYADVSLNTELETIKLLAKVARKYKKVHKIIIMIEMGDLREGIMGSKLIPFYEKVFKLKGIKVIGIGTNLNCLHGVMPSQDKMIQLGLYKQIIELKFNQKLAVVSGGSTVTIPLLLRKQIPKTINHFRVGEALFFGADLFTKGTIKGMFPSVFQLSAEIIEICEKPKIPNGVLEENPRGELLEIDEDDYGKFAYRALLDVGILDVDPKYLYPVDSDIQVVGASSDMIVIEIPKKSKIYKIGQHIKFNLKYMGALSLMNSKYIDKVVI